MKKYVLSIIILILSITRGYPCGFSLYGEDIRFSLFQPSYFNYEQYASFYFNAHLFGFPDTYKEDNQAIRADENIASWVQYFEGKVPAEAIYDVLYVASETEIRPDNNNPWLMYLYANQRDDVLQYLTQAKQIETLNQRDVEDPWERNSVLLMHSREAKIKTLDSLGELERDPYIQRRYAFLQIRLAYYHNDFETIKRTFSKYFHTNNQDFLYYWSLYFLAFTEEDNEQMIADVSVYASDKLHAAYYYFHKEFDLAKGLQQARTKTQKANLYAYASLQKVDENLAYLKEIYKNDARNSLLDFLLLREMNKLEDWIYTPYYANFQPSITYSNSHWSSTNNTTIQKLRERSEEDRKYAREVLHFVNSVALHKVNNPMLWQAAKVQLLFMVREYKKCIQLADIFMQQYPQEAVSAEIEQIKVLAIIAQQPMNNAIIPLDVQEVIMKHNGQRHFMFALGRELEYLGNISDGMALISYANSHFNISSDIILDYYDREGIYWQGHISKKSGNLTSFYEYFDYLDFVYTAKELQTIVQQISKAQTTPFDNAIYKVLAVDINYLKDLLGTKYIREGNLEAALAVFEDLGSAYFNNNYNAWERDRFDNGSYAFEENPFFDLKYTPNFIDKRDTFLVNKISITQHLIDYLALANNPSTPDRSYYYFIVANCYLNMAHSGHAWMMRRFSSFTSYLANENFVDDQEYNHNILAQKYYALAAQYSDVPKFKALCLRMQEFAQANYPNDFKQLDAKYPEFYYELSNCIYLDTYFKSRHKNI